MSGGSMDYVAWRIRDASERIQHELANIEFQKRNCVAPEEPHKSYVNEHPEYAAFKDGEAMRDAVIDRMREALVTCRRAAIYAERVEWLTSGDDGYENFLLRLDKQLNECARTGGAM